MEVENRLSEFVVLGGTEFKDVSIQEENQELQREIQARIQSILHTIAETGNYLPERMLSVRSLLKKTRIDATRYRPSSESLLRRLRKGEKFPSVNPAVDINNLCSLKFLLPMGIYDRKTLEGEKITVRLGEKGEGYISVSNQWVMKEGKLLLSDDKGPFGSPTMDSKRTSVSTDTTRTVSIIYCPRTIPVRELEICMEEASLLFLQYCKGRVEGQWIS